MPLDNQDFRNLAMVAKYVSVEISKSSGSIHVNNRHLHMISFVFEVVSHGLRSIGYDRDPSNKQRIKSDT